MALEELVARWLGVPKRTVSVAAGGKSRLKALRIVGDRTELDKLLQIKADEFHK